MTNEPFKVNVGTSPTGRWKEVGGTSTSDGRLKLWDDQKRWVQELRDGEAFTEAHPLKMKTATGWEQVAILGIPSEGIRLTGIPRLTGDFPDFRTSVGTYTPFYFPALRYQLSGAYPFMLTDDDDASFGAIWNTGPTTSGFGPGIMLDPYVPPAGMKIVDAVASMTYKVTQLGGVAPTTSGTTPRVMLLGEWNQDAPTGPWPGLGTALYSQPVTEYGVWKKFTLRGGLSTDADTTEAGSFLYYTDVATGSGSLAQLQDLLQGNAYGEGLIFHLSGGLVAGAQWEFRCSDINVTVTLGPV